MPNIRPGWTPKQSVHLRVAAIELLLVGHTGQQAEEYLDVFFQEWLMVYGMPVVRNGLTADAVLAIYKAVRCSERLDHPSISIFFLRSESLLQSNGIPLLGQTDSKSP